MLPIPNGEARRMLAFCSTSPSFTMCEQGARAGRAIACITIIPARGRECGEEH